MASTVRRSLRSVSANDRKHKVQKKEEPGELKMTNDDETNEPDNSLYDEELVEDTDDFDFVSHYGVAVEEQGDELLPENTAGSAISCAIIGVGGAGGKLAKAFIDIGFNKTLLVNTTKKDQPAGLDENHLVLLPGTDGVGKDVKLGHQIIEDNSTLVEDALRNRVGTVDWIFVVAGGGGGTGSACHALNDSLHRYLKSVGGGGSVVYVLTAPSSQELLNPTIKRNFGLARESVTEEPHLILDNEKQLQLLRGRMGMLNMYPAANSSFAKMLAQVFRLAGASSPLQVFDTKDLERCLRTPGRFFLGTTVVPDPTSTGLGSRIYQECIKNSPCSPPAGTPAVGALLLCLTEEAANNPTVSNHLEATMAYVGGRSEALFSGVYIRPRLPGLVSILLLGGLK